MHTEYYGLHEHPFQMTPNARLYFASSAHRRAHAHLTYGLAQHEGFIVVTGEVGAGKTTLIERLCDELDPHNFVIARITTTLVSGDDVLRMVADAFGAEPDGNKAAVLRGIAAALRHSHRRHLLIVDEAQGLVPDALEELRMLSNLTHPGQPPLQTLLMGQPELRRLLVSPALAQLRQRVLASYHLSGLTREETHAYVMHRLQAVGWAGRPTWEPAALDLVHAHSDGLPRRINRLCARVLLSGALEGLDHLTADMVGMIAQELEQDLGGDPMVRVPAPRGVARPAEAVSPYAPPPQAAEALAEPPSPTPQATPEPEAPPPPPDDTAVASTPAMRSAAEDVAPPDGPGVEAPHDEPPLPITADADEARPDQQVPDPLAPQAESQAPIPAERAADHTVGDTIMQAEAYTFRFDPIADAPTQQLDATLAPAEHGHQPNAPLASADPWTAIQETPVEEPRAEAPPAEEPPEPRQESPVEEPPVQEPPVQDPPADDPPMQEPPMQEPPVQEPPVKDPRAAAPAMVADAAPAEEPLAQFTPHPQPRGEEPGDADPPRAGVKLPPTLVPMSFVAIGTTPRTLLPETLISLPLMAVTVQRPTMPMLTNEAEVMFDTLTRPPPLPPIVPSRRREEEPERLFNWVFKLLPNNRSRR